MKGERDAFRTDVDSYREENVGLNLGAKEYGFVHKQLFTPRTARELNATPDGRTCSLPGARTVHDLLKDELSRLEAAAQKHGPPLGEAASRRFLTAEKVARLASIRLIGRPVPQARILETERSMALTLKRLSFFTPDGAQLPAVLLIPIRVSEPPTIICGDGPRTARLARARRSLFEGSPVLLPDLCGWGELGHFTRKFSGQAVSDETLAMTWYPLGRSLVGIRAENILDCAALLTAHYGRTPRLVAYGRAVIPAVHARFVAPAAFTDAVEMHDKPPAWADEIRTGAKANFADSVHGALAVYDWPMLLP